MRKFVLLLIFILPVVTSAQSLPEWFRVYTFDDSTIEMNTLLISRISDDVNRVRFRWTFTESQPLRDTPTVKYLSELEVMEFNCSKKSYRPYHVTFIDETGNIVRIHDSPGEWRDVATSRMVEKLFVPACELIKNKTEDHSAVEESDRVKLFAYDFFRHLERAKDFRPLISQYFLDNYLDGYLKDRHTNWFLNLERATAAKVSHQELERFYVATMNAGYVTWLYLISQQPSGSEERVASLRLLPPDVLTLVRNHEYTAKFGRREGNFDFLADKIDSVEKMRLYTDLLERIAVRMRSSGEKVGAVTSIEWRQIRERSGFFEPRVQDCKNCFALPDGTRVFGVTVPIFKLQVAEVHGTLKVVSAKIDF